MDKHTYTSRRARHAKAGSVKTGLWILLIMLILVLTGGSIYTAYALQHKTSELPVIDDEAQYKQKEADLLAKIRETQEKAELKSVAHETKEATIQTLIYEPNVESIPQLSTIKNTLTALVADTQKVQPKNSKIKLVGWIKQVKVNEQVIGYEPVVDIYTWNKDNIRWDEQTTTSKNHLFINQKTQQPLTLQDIFMNEANTLAIQQVIQQKLLAESSDGNAVIDSVLNMPTIPLNETKFTYQPDKITLALPKNATEKTDITLAYREIAGYVNPAFIDASSIKEALPAPLEPNKKYISLTFDDGPNPKTTPRLLDILKAKNVKATFFMLGQNVAKHEAIVKRVNEEGHEVASHSYSHPQLTSQEAQTVKEEVQKTDKAIYHAIGKLPSDFRPPYGAVNQAVAALIDKPIIQWSVDSQDWQSHNTEAIIKRVDETAYNDTIILMHDIYPESIDAVPTIIDHLREAGYEILPSKELLGKKARPLHMYYGSKDERSVQ